MSDAFEPELGQVLFGSDGDFAHAMQSHVEAGLRGLSDLLAEVKRDSRSGFASQGPAGNIGPDIDEDNEVFALRAYCWCDGAQEGHEQQCPPNFEHYASGFKASWYKYLGRGSSQNTILSVVEWERIRAECVAKLLEEKA